MEPQELKIKTTAFLKEVENGLPVWENFYVWAIDLINIERGLRRNLSWKDALDGACAHSKRPYPTRLEIDDLKEWLEKLLSLSGSSRLWPYNESLNRTQIKEQRTKWIDMKLVAPVLSALRRLLLARKVWGKSFDLDFPRLLRRDRDGIIKFFRLTEWVDVTILKCSDLIRNYNNYIEHPDYADLHLERGCSNCAPF